MIEFGLNNGNDILGLNRFKEGACDSIQNLESSFDRLPLDPYIDGKFRRRRLSRFIAPGGQLRALPHQEFTQSDQYNHLLGNIRREYEELEADVAMSNQFILMLNTIATNLDLNLETSVLGVHQIRITVDPNHAGHPAPEGIHKDGFDFIAITCVMRKDVMGGHTELYKDPNDAPVFSKILEAGDMLFIDDRNLFHYTAPLQPVEGDGHRDVFVVTVKTNEPIP